MIAVFTFVGLHFCFWLGFMPYLLSDIWLVDFVMPCGLCVTHRGVVISMEMIS